MRKPIKERIKAVKKEVKQAMKRDCERIIQTNAECEFDKKNCVDCLLYLICIDKPDMDRKELLEIARTWLDDNYNNLFVSLEISCVGDCQICKSRFDVDKINSLCRAFGEWLHRGDIIEPCDKCIEHRKQL